MPKKDKQGTEDTPKGGKKGAAEKKEIDPQKYQQVGHNLYINIVICC